MEFFEVVNNRRSIRKFAKEKVSSDIIKALIEVAQKAPSWKNSQVSRYYAAVSEEKINEVWQSLPEFNRNNTENAGAFIISTVKTNIAGMNMDGTYSSHLKDGFQYFDNGLQVENICLAAYNLGLGTLIMGLYDEPKIRSIFNVPNNEIIVCVIAVGVPDIEPTMPQRKPLDNILKIY